MDWDEVKQDIRGPAVLVMAPFRKDLSVHLEALKQNLRYIYAGGIKKGQGFVISPGGTGEYVHLSEEEHRQMVEAAIAATDGELPIVAGVASTDLRVAIKLTANARQAGARVVMCPPPFYYTLDEDAFCEWYRLLAEAVPDVGIMVYDQSWRRELNSTITLPIMERLSRIPNVISLKYGSPAHYYDMITALERWSGRYAFIDNSLGYTATVGHMHGSAGFISGPAAFAPRFELDYWRLLEAGQYQEAERFHYRLAPFMTRFFAGGTEFGGQVELFQAAILRAALEYVGLYGGPCRPPFSELTREQKEAVFASLDQIKVVERSAATLTAM